MTQTSCCWMTTYRYETSTITHVMFTQDGLTFLCIYVHVMACVYLVEV